MSDRKRTLALYLGGSAALLGLSLLAYLLLSRRKRLEIHFITTADNVKVIRKDDLLSLLTLLRDLCKDEVKKLVIFYRSRRRAAADDPTEYEQLVEKMYEKIEKVYTSHLISLLKQYSLSQTLLDRSIEAHMCPEIVEKIENITQPDAENMGNPDPRLIKAVLASHSKIYASLLDSTDITCLNPKILSAMIEDKIFFEHKVELGEFLKKVEKMDNDEELRVQLASLKDSLYKLRKKNQNLFNIA